MRALSRLATRSWTSKQPVQAAAIPCSAHRASYLLPRPFSIEAQGPRHLLTSRACWTQRWLLTNAPALPAYRPRLGHLHDLAPIPVLGITRHSSSSHGGSDDQHSGLGKPASRGQTTVSEADSGVLPRFLPLTPSQLVMPREDSHLAQEQSSASTSNDKSSSGLVMTPFEHSSTVSALELRYGSISQQVPGGRLQQLEGRKAVQSIQRGPKKLGGLAREAAGVSRRGSHLTHGSTLNAAGNIGNVATAGRKLAAKAAHARQLTQLAAKERTRQWLGYMGFDPMQSENLWLCVDSLFVGAPIDVEKVVEDMQSLHQGPHSRPSRREQCAVLVVPHDRPSPHHAPGACTVMVVDGFGAVTFFSRANSATADELESEVQLGQHKGALRRRDDLVRQVLQHRLSGASSREPDAARRDPNESWPRESLNVVVKKLPSQCHVQKVGDDYAVPHLDERMLIIMSKVLGQSAALQHYDRSAEMSLDKLSSIYDRIGSSSLYLMPLVGRLLRGVATRDLVMLVVETDKQYIDVIRKPRLLDDPRFAWHQDRHYDFYKALKDEFDIAHRLEMLATKLEGVTEGAKFLVDMRGARTGLISEIVIIVLILYEVILHPDSLPHSFINFIASLLKGGSMT